MYLLEFGKCFCSHNVSRRHSGRFLIRWYFIPVASGGSSTSTSPNSIKVLSHSFRSFPSPERTFLNAQWFFFIDSNNQKLNFSHLVVLRSQNSRHYTQFHKIHFFLRIFYFHILLLRTVSDNGTIQEMIAQLKMVENESTISKDQNQKLVNKPILRRSAKETKNVKINFRRRLHNNFIE